MIRHARSSVPAQPGERLAKRVMQIKACSRKEAEMYIEGGWVRVDGNVVQDLPMRVTHQRVTIDADAQLADLTAVTLLVHKPVGWPDGHNTRPQRQQSLLQVDTHWRQDSTQIRVLQRHTAHQEAQIPLETGASGLLVFTQDWRISRKLQDDMGTLEHELLADVAGAMSPDAMHAIARLLSDPRAALPSVKCSLSASTPERSKLRFAVKGAHPGLVAYVCERAGLELLALKRIRLGRVALRDLPTGQWRYLAPFERF